MLCRELACNRSLLYAWINSNDARREGFKQARALAADSHADEAVTLVDAADPDLIGVARARAGYRRWLAQSFNRDQFAANPPATGPVLNIGQLHLYAVSKTNEELQRLVEAPVAALPARIARITDGALQSDAKRRRGHPTRRCARDAD